MCFSGQWQCSQVSRRPQVVDGSRDRARNLVEGDRVELVHAVDLGRDVAPRPLPDVAFHAGNPRVGVAAVLGQLWPHRRVAHHPAEAVGFRVNVGLIAADRRQQEIDKGQGAKDAQEPAVPLPREVDLKRRGLAKALEPGEGPAPPPGAEQEDSDAEREEGRRDDVAEDPEVGVRLARARDVQCEQEQERKEAPARDDEPRKAEPIAPDREPGGPRRLGVWRGLTHLASVRT